MLVIKKVENKLVLNLFSFVIILFIGFLDYFTGEELSFSIFYIFPIAFISLYKNTKKSTVILNAVFASIIWLIVEYNNHQYSSSIFLIWNSIVRLAFFLIIGLLSLILKEKYKEIKKMNKNLKELNIQINKFVGIAAHDLRNPVSAIYSFSDIIISKYGSQLSQKISEYLKSIKNLSGNTLELLEDLLDISKIESGIIEIKAEKQDYIKFIEYNISINQLIADKKEITINFESSEKELISNFDNKYLSEVINNLLTNAIKYSNPKSDILVKVSLVGSESIKTEVIDKGPGIPENEQDKLFGYFQTTSIRPTFNEKSTGLGLAIAKKIVVEHHGTISLHSEPGKGSNFYYIIPKEYQSMDLFLKAYAD